MDRLVLLLVIAAASACLAASRSRLLQALSLAPALVIAVVFFIAWLDERQATSGDPQPGTVQAVGIAATSVILLAALGGWFWRMRRDSRRDS